MQDRAHLPVMSPLTLLRAFLAALRDPDGSRDSLRLHAPDTLVCHGQRVRRVSEVDPADVARSHRETCELGANLLSGTRLATHTDGTLQLKAVNESGRFRVPAVYAHFRLPARRREWTAR